jgi:hypothetical protein
MQQATTQDKVTAAGEAAHEARTSLLLKRQELRDQLNELSRRRNQLLEQRNGANGAQTTDINARITVIDQRAAQIENQLFAANDAIADNLGGPVAASVKAALDAQQAALEAAQAGTTQPAEEALRMARGAVEDAVYESFAAGVTTILAFTLVWRGFRRFVLKKKAPAALPDNSAQIAQLQQSMDAIAIEVERISEAQRFTAKMLNDRQKASLS